MTAKKTDITFFNDTNIATYKIKSDNSYITSNTKEILLLGNVILNRLEGNPITMYSDKVKWNSQEATINFSGNVYGIMDTSSIRSEQAVYYQKTQKMIFSNLKEYVVTSKDNTSKTLEILANQAIWDGESGKLSFKSPNNSVRSKILIPFTNKK